MANCPEYLDLIPRERIEFLGKVIHAIQSDSAMFAAAQTLIKKAERKGLFEGITINPIEQNNIIEPPNNIEL